MDALLQAKAAQLAQEIAGEATTWEDLNGLMQQMMKSALETMLDTEMDVHLGRRELQVKGPIEEKAASAESPSPDTPAEPANRRNGHSQKTVKGDFGELKLSTPRDRNGTFDPQLIGKYQRRLPGFDEKILALYAKGMTTRDIQETIKASGK